MTSTIKQNILFKNTTATQLYHFYMDAKLHADLTGDEAVISDKEAAPFSAYRGYITGKNLQLIKDTLIVQAWRATDWATEDIDSTFILKLEPKGKDVLLRMVHANIPLQQAEGLKKGWHDFYWNPWKAHIRKTKK